MIIFRSRAAAILFAAASTICLLLAAGSARAFMIGVYPQIGVVVDEYFNVQTGHYFYAPPSDDSEAIASGRAGAGWVKTGLGFWAFTSLQSTDPSRYSQDCPTWPSPCVVVSRFYAPSANSHFFTGNVEETRILRQPGSGWIYEKTAFVLPLPNEAGQCEAPRTPVYRLYNNRWMFNDSNHRFTPSLVARDRMIAQGWRDEGVGFCALGISTAAVSYQDLRQQTPAVHARVDCDQGSPGAGACVAVDNVPVPGGAYPPALDLDPFNARTGIFRRTPSIQAILGLPAFSREAAASDVFVQFANFGNVFGFHLVTRSHGPSPWSSMEVQQLVTGERLFPWRPSYSTDYELVMRFGIGLQHLAVEPGAHAYGNAAMEFVDSTSGRRVPLHILAYGTLSAADGAALDKDGVALVATSFNAGTPFGSSPRSSTFATPSSFQSAGDGQGSATFEYRIDRASFARLLAAARSKDPALSASPDDYFVRRWGVQNEVFGQGEIGLYVGDGELSLYPRY